MNLSPQQKERLIKTATYVYESYLALDFFKTKSLTINKNLQRSLFDYCVDSSNHPGLQIIEIGNTTYHLHSKAISGQIDQLECTLTRPIHLPTTNELKLPNMYDDEKSCDLLCDRIFVIESNSANGNTVALKMNANLNLGGAGKIDLYRSHLITLFNIIQKIESETEITNLLVALSTGSGKTFVQALWLLILHLGQFNGIFALPDKLVEQFVRDLKHFLPDSFVSNIIVIHDRNASLFPDLSLSGQMIIASNHYLLDEHYQTILAASPEKLFLNFDEQHLVMKHERRSKRLLALSERFLSMFLTATPDQKTYQLSGCEPVAMMSSGQKAKAGQGQFSSISQIHCEFIKDFHRKQAVDFGTVAYKEKLINGLLLRVSDSFQPECSSAAKAVLTQLPYLLERKPGETDLRWQLQIPMARKILCVVDDNESLVNICNGLESLNQNIYHNGNFVKRQGVAKLLGREDADKIILAQEKKRRQEEYINNLSELERNILNPIFKQRDILQAQLKSNIFHYLIEYVLSDLTDLNMIEHNRLRKDSLEDFSNLIKRKFRARNFSYYEEKLNNQVSQEDALQLSLLLGLISEYLGSQMPVDTTGDIQEEDPVAINQFADNWFLDNTLYEKIINYRHKFKYLFDIYVKNHMVLGMMGGMEEAETPITDSQPFFGLQEDCYNLYDSGDKPKNRQRTSLELLNDRAQESSFTPRYQKISAEMADNYFRLGFVGVYISNMKTEGFNDPNLHTVINVVEKTNTLNNDPTILIQSMGRNRGLDETAIPHYIHALGREQKTYFDLNALNKDDYYPDLFSAQTRYQKHSVQLLGEELGKDILAWYHAHMEVDETIDAEKLKRQSLKFVAKALRRLNAQANHKIHVSRQQLPQVLAHAMKVLDKEIAYIKKPYTISFIIRALGSLFNFASELYFVFLRFKPALAFYQHAWTLAKKNLISENDKADQIYMKIIQHGNFKRIVSQTLVMAEFNSWRINKSKAIQHSIKKHIYSYATPELKAQMIMHLENAVFPFLEKNIIPSKLNLVKNKLHEVEDFYHLMVIHEDSFKAIFDETQSEHYANNVLRFLHQIPGLENLNNDDMLPFKESVMQDMAWFQQERTKTIHETPELKEKTNQELVHFMQYDLPQYLNAFVAQDDERRINEVLHDTAKIGLFVERLMGYPKSDLNSLSVDRILMDFKEIFELPDIHLLPQRRSHVQEQLKILRKNFTDEHIRENISPLFLNELLPCLVNYYPLEDRKRLLDEIKIEDLTVLLQNQNSALIHLIESEQTPELAQFLFIKLCSNVPALIDIQKEADKSKLFFDKQSRGFQGMWNAAYVAMGRGTSRIETLLKSKGFLDAIALLLPFHHWLELKARFSNESQSFTQLAVAIHKILENKAEFNEVILLEKINAAFNSTYKLTPDYAQSIGQQLKTLSTPEAVILTAQQENKIAEFIRTHCLPLMAAFVAPEKRSLFLSYTYTDKNLCELFRKHQTTLIQAKTISTAIGPIILDFCSCLDADDLIDPEEYALSEKNQCNTNVTQRLKTMFLTSDIFKSKLKGVFNEKDYQFLMDACFPTKEQAATIVDCAWQTEQSNQNDFLNHIRAQNPVLQNVQTLKENMDAFQSFIQTLDDHKLYDKEKISDLVLSQLCPILRHAQFRASIDLFLGALNQNDITLIFEAKKIENPDMAAAQLLKLQALVHRKDWKSFKKEFILCGSTEHSDFDLEKIPFIQTMKHFSLLMQEVMACHCYYNNHNESGEVFEAKKPSLFLNMSDTLKEVRLSQDGSFMSKYSRKIFFLQGLKNGFPKAGQVSKDANKNKISILQRVRNHILKPMWWATNTSKFFYYIIKLCKNLVFAIGDILLATYRGVKFFAYWITCNSNLYRSPESNSDDMEYNNAAFECAKVANELIPLTLEQIAEPNCPKDVVIKVERAIDPAFKPPIRLFDGRAHDISRDDAASNLNRSSPVA